MTIAELIEKLSRYPSDMLIAIRDDCPADAEDFETINVAHRMGDSEVILVIV